jgi:hypothetical protein
MSSRRVVIALLLALVLIGAAVLPSAGQVGNNRRCFLPVTFTQAGWALFSDPNNLIINGGMLYNRFPMAFAQFTYYGPLGNASNKVIIGLASKGKTITFTGTGLGLGRLAMFFPQLGAPGSLFFSYLNPTQTTGGQLAGELLALQLNIAYNDMRLMPRTAGYDLEKFILAKGLFKGKTVREVRNIANAILAGDPPCMYGLDRITGLADLTQILLAINSNYEFVNYSVFVDLGYLIPNRPFGEPDPPTIPVVP